VRKFHAAFFCLIISGMIHAQSSSIWFAGQLGLRKKKWEWHQDAGYRTIGVGPKATLWFYRTGARHYFNEHWNVAAGYALFDARVDKNKPAFSAENRIWEEVVRQDQWKKLRWVQRIRIDHRRFNANSRTEAFTAHRLRYRTAFIRTIHPKIDLQVYDEIMIQRQHGDWLLNQNRIGMFVHVRTGKQQLVNLGYTRMQLPSGNSNLLHVGFQHQLIY
jgi:hypothetical protein